MPKLNDTQLVLLSTAAKRDDGSLYPLPKTLTAAGVTKALPALIKGSLIEEREVTSAALVHRSDGDDRYGLTATGLQAIGVEAGEGAPAAVSEPAPAVPRQRRCCDQYG